MSDYAIRSERTWPCGHVEVIMVPGDSARSELTFYGPDEQQPLECSICSVKLKHEAEAKSSAEALKNADNENSGLRFQVRRLEEENKLRLAADSRVDRLIGLVERLVENR